MAWRVLLASVSLCMYFYLAKRVALYGPTYRVFKLQVKQIGGGVTFPSFEKRHFPSSRVYEPKNFARGKPPAPILSLLTTSFPIPVSHKAAAFCILQGPFGSIHCSYFPSYRWYLAKVFLFLSLCVFFANFDNYVHRAFPCFSCIDSCPLLSPQLFSKHFANSM